MRKLIILLVLLPFLFFSASATDYTAPPVPEEGEQVFPEDPTSFTDGLMEIFGNSLNNFRPALTTCLQSCGKILCVIILTALLASTENSIRSSICMASCLAISVVLLTPTNNLIFLGEQTVTDLIQYGKLLLPVMASALAAQGAISSAGAMYAGTAFLNAFLGSLLTGVLIPLLYMYLVLSCSGCILEEELLNKLKGFVKWLLVWSLKLILYIFTGYMSITGVIAGTTDASAIKATKITLSGVVPVVGGIISDASEAILLSAGVMKNSAGIYGILALVSILITPFLKIGVQYLSLKLTTAACQLFTDDKSIQLLQDFTTAMGLLLAMTGTACLLQTISTVCFMRGAGI